MNCYSKLRANYISFLKTKKENKYTVSDFNSQKSGYLY